jgi:hypothetical protein
MTGRNSRHTKAENAAAAGITHTLVFFRRRIFRLSYNRTDIQKLESAGFDKIVSFRNIK